MKITSIVICPAVAAFAATYLAFSPIAQAVSPAPDGGYVGGNTAEGQNALLSLTTGTYNTAVGVFSLLSNTKGNFNTGIGAGALLANIGDPPFGHGIENTATGAGALLSNTVGFANTADGAFALFRNVGGDQNTACGWETLENNDGGLGNTAVGSHALHDNLEGERNTAVGQGALCCNTNGDDNVALGSNAGANVIAANHVICIGSNVPGFDVSNTCYIGSIRGAQVGIDGIPVLIDSSEKLGTATSSRRFKENIRPINKASETILRLQPVTFRYRKQIDPAGRSQFGLVAEDVERVNPDLVVRDKEGKPYTVRYDAVNAMLLNEFLKEHRKVQELEKRIAILTAQFKEQAAQIQKVSAQVQMNQPTAKVASLAAVTLREGGE